jgi:hypothetical protein
MGSKTASQRAKRGWYVAYLNQSTDQIDTAPIVEGDSKI